MMIAWMVPWCLVTGQDSVVSPTGARESQVIHLDQGWSSKAREFFYSTAQGSQLIPFDWFLALERKHYDSLFRAANNIDRLGFLVQSRSSWNPRGLPVGFVEDADI